MTTQKREWIRVEVILSIAPGVTPAEARRELRTRCNELCCYTDRIEESDVRVRAVSPSTQYDNMVRAAHFAGEIAMLVPVDISFQCEEAADQLNDLIKQARKLTHYQRRKGFK